MEMNFQTALLDVRQMGEADQLTVASGKSVIELMGNAGSSVAHEIEKRWRNIFRDPDVFGCKAERFLVI
jgi:NAD(P)H-hydrate repair Nnr-like enzyme with NAD(P)H-hydrate epimerase domain